MSIPKGNAPDSTDTSRSTSSEVHAPAQDDPDSKKWTDGLLDAFKDKPVAFMPVDRNSEEYNMKHPNRGKAIIFNNKEFMQSGLSKRNGTDADRNKLKRSLIELGFDVQVFDDPTKRIVMNTVLEVSQEDHTDRDCVLIAVFSHGDLNCIHAYDAEYKPDYLWEPFAANLCPTLAGKPKIFLIQACQGDQVDGGTVLRSRARTQVDGKSIPDKQYTVPNRADFLTVYSTVPGYYSWRNTTDGSWFIQSVSNTLRTYSATKDLLSMMTLIARDVAFNFESCVPGDPDMDRKKQVPLITSTLTRNIYFR